MPFLEDTIKTPPSSPAAALLRQKARLRLSPRVKRALGWLAVVVYFTGAFLILTLRYAVLPNIEDYRGNIEQALSTSLELPVTITRIDADWHGLRPSLTLRGLRIHDRENRPALAFDHVEAELAWTSLLHFDLRFYRLEIFSPTLTIRRDAAGQIYIAGLRLNIETPQSGTDFSDWLLAQHRLIVRDASITWIDALRAAPPLALHRLNLYLQNKGNRHRFGMTAEPAPQLADRLDVRGDFRGANLETLADWKGEIYTTLDYADLAIWRQWVDYPIELPQGSGALRLWLSFVENNLVGGTADIALHNVKMRLAEDLPLLDLRRLTGRIDAKRLPNGFAASGKRLALLTHDGIQVEPSDFTLSWNEAAGQKPASGAFLADVLDFDALSRLAAYLPLEATTRRQLDDFAPRGKLFDLAFRWSGNTDAQGKSLAPRYNIDARFERLGVNAQGALPGFIGLSGSVVGDENGGVFRLASQAAALELPAVFAEPHIELGALNAQARWKTSKNDIDVQLESANFENPDAAGSITGRYVYPNGENSSPGEIDLHARLSRGQGPAVWRYIPLAVGHGVREWLRSAIVGGHSDETTLRLKGDLTHFPFADGSGIFEVKGRIQGASLRYADGWPQIDNITGSLEFIGNRMLIKADAANIYGANLSHVSAEVSDLAADDNLLVVTGQASGPTADFLRFIEESPVGAQIDHFTEDMTAQGNGRLELTLKLPLQHITDTRLNGVYQFIGNRLKIDPDLPPLGDVQGRLHFTESSLSAERVRATLLGTPLAFDLKTSGAGLVTVEADGQMRITDLRRELDHPLLDQLSGSSAWRGTILARKKSAEVVIESSLLGLSSSLPEPFNKSANAAMPLRFERKRLPTGKTATAASSVAGAAATATATVFAASARDQLTLALGHQVAARLIRRKTDERAESSTIERGAIAIGEPLTLPDNGVSLAVNVKKLDVDLWRNLLLRPSKEAAGIQGAPLPLSAITLKTPIFEAYGHTLNDLEVRAGLTREGGWRADLKSRDVSGELFWKGQGSGRLGARLKQLVIHQASAQAAQTAAPAKIVTSPPRDDREPMQPEDLPGLDIEVEQFTLRNKALGRLKLTADNREGAWEARLDMDNEDGRLSGTGRWRPHTTQADTQLKFTLTAKSVEKLLTRLGYADAVKRGKATLDGNVSWNGAPFAIDYPTLSGALKVDAENGQFNKLEPGVGRLLGILSLQALPRRITLDFRDVFSQGFAFDSIRGQLTMHDGVIQTNGLEIRGPSAKVLMSGSASVPEETQNLRVRVQPAISESIAVGAMIANPAAGAIAWLAQKALRDPLDQAFAFEYAVTGSWADPKVEKLAGPQPRAETPGDKGH